jgi:uncharacterized membrane protein
MPKTDEHPRQTLSLVDRFFRWGVVGKGVYGAAELILGVLLTLVTTSTLQSWVDVLTQRELIHDPNDLLSTALVSMVDGLSSSAVLFAAIYLIAHGVVKLGLFTSVMTRAYRVYPWAIAILVAFIGYQVFDLITAFTVGLLLLTVFDIAIVALTWRDYRRHARSEQPVSETR